jgi:hypothetical protein
MVYPANASFTARFFTTHSRYICEEGKRNNLFYTTSRNGIYIIILILILIL